MPSQPTNLFGPADQIGQREDFLDFIKNISPTERPFLSNIRTGKRAKGVFVEHQTDVIRPAADNAAVDGQDFSSAAVAPTVRIGNYLQTLTENVVVAGISREIDLAGRRDELSYQLTLKGMAMMNDLEHIATNNYASTAGASDSARHMASTESWISSNVQKAGAADGTTKGWASGVVTSPADSSTVGALTSLLLKGAIKACWSAGGNATFVLCGGTNKETMSGFSGVATLYKDVPGMSQAVIVDGADVYVSNFGQHIIVPSRFVRARTVQIIDPNCWEIRYLRRMKTLNIGPSGDSFKRQLVMDATLLSLQEMASAKIVDTNAT